MSSDCSIICGLPDSPWEAAGRVLPPAPQARAVRKILSRCQWRDYLPCRIDDHLRLNEFHDAVHDKEGDCKPA